MKREVGELNSRIGVSEINYQAKLVQILNHTAAVETQFLDEQSELREGFQVRATDWTAQDVSAHLSEWRLIAGAKLAAIGRNEIVKFRHDDLDELNQRNYEKHRSDSLPATRRLITESCRLLQLSIETINQQQWSESGQLTGLNLPLWRYALIDSLTHPLIHMVAFYLEKQMFQKGLALWEESYPFLNELQPTESLLRNYYNLESLLSDVKNEPGFRESWRRFVADNQDRALIGKEIIAGFTSVNGID